MWPFTRKPVVPVVRLTGPIGLSTPLRPGLSLALLADTLERAFRVSKLPSVVLLINSPGGSAVQSNLIFRRVRQLAAENRKTVYVFCEDVAASGGYFLAIAGDEIYADPSSIIGSIGVISAGFGFDRAIDRLGITRRVYTAGVNKGSLDPFLPENADDVSRLKVLQKDIHDVFIGIVKERRGAKLKGSDGELFSGAFWSGPKALELGFIDGITDVRSRMREIHGPNVVFRMVQPAGGGLLGRLRRLPMTGLAGAGAGLDGRLAIADDVLSAFEERQMWARFGL